MLMHTIIRLSRQLEQLHSGVWTAPRDEAEELFKALAVNLSLARTESRSLSSYIMEAKAALAETQDRADLSDEARAELSEVERALDNARYDLYL